MLPGKQPAKVFFYACIIFCAYCFPGPTFLENNVLGAETPNFSTIIDPDEYMIGPGDQFRIDFWDGSGGTLNLTVTPEGTVLLTSMGVGEVGGMTLTEAKQKLRELISRFYSDIDFSISLSGVRQLKILVAGGVRRPGLYDVYVSQRVSEIINKAGGFAEGASKRNIRLSCNGDGHVVDVLRFERTGELDADPYIYSGYKIHVPFVTDSTSFLQISGEVISPGGFEYKEGDSLGLIIDLAQGFTGLQGDSIYIFRRVGEGFQKLAVSTSEPDVLIFPGDKIVVSRVKKDLAPDFYSVSGAVAAPGRYPYDRNSNFDQVLDMAGGLSDDADVYSTVIYRSAEFKRSQETIESLNAMNLNNLSFLSTAEPVSLDIGRFYPDRLGEVAVFPGDSIVVPVRTGSVGVYGMVNRPGMLAYSGPVTASSVIRLAGGYAREADRRTVKIIRKTSGLKITTKPNIDIYDGDTVIVPEDKRKKSTWDKIKDLSMILGGMGVVYLAIDNMVE